MGWEKLTIITYRNHLAKVKRQVKKHEKGYAWAADHGKTVSWNQSYETRRGRDHSSLHNTKEMRREGRGGKPHPLFKRETLQHEYHLCGTGGGEPVNT